ncbi:hypothetical protein [Salmonella sp. s55044]|uniref:hypothetical protein n=1 Tax=Salmonella sp. s55044 TaxID=3159677 RepID=UPI00397F8FFB
MKPCKDHETMPGTWNHAGNMKPRREHEPIVGKMKPCLDHETMPGTWNHAGNMKPKLRT